VCRGRALLIGLCLMACASLLHGQGQSGFSGRALSLAYLDESGLFLIGEAGGFISLYDPDTRSLVRRFQVAQGSLRLIAAREGSSDFVLVDSSAYQGPVLKCYRYADGLLEERFEAIPLSESPAALAISPKGGLIGLALKDATGYALLDGADGSPISLPYQAGPSSFITLGSSETSMLLYANNGRLVYVGIPSGKVMLEVRSLQGLSNLRLSRDKKSIYAISASGELLSIDAQSGRTRRNYGIKGCLAFELGEGDAPILVSTTTGGLFLLPTDGPSQTLPYQLPPVARLAVGSGSALIASEEGQVWALKPDNPDGLTPIQAEAFVPLFDACALNGIQEGRSAFLLATAAGFFALSLPHPGSLGLGEGVHDEETLDALPTGSQQKGNDSQLDEALSFRPLIGGEGMAGIEEVALAASGGMAWAALDAAEGSRIIAIDVRGGTEREVADSPSRLRSITAALPGAIAVYENRSAAILSPAGILRSWQPIPGLHCGLWTDKDRILFAKNLGGGLPAVLLLSKSSTGELVPLRHEALSVFKLFPDARSGMAWGLGIIEEGGATNTALWSLTMEPFRAILEAKAPGERFEADLVTLSDGGAAYTFGDRFIMRVGGDAQAEVLGFCRSYPRRLRASEGILMAIERDDSFELFDDVNGSILGRYAFLPGEGLIRLDGAPRGEPQGP